MGDARGHLADRREPLLHARAALEPPDVGYVLEREEIPAAAIRQRERRGRQADVQHTAIGRAVLMIGAMAARFAERPQPSA